MPFVVLPDMRKVYRDTGHLELEDFLTSGQVDSLNDGINRVLSKGEGKLDFSKKYLLGRDMFRKENLVKEIVLKKKYASFAKDLLQQYEIMMGFDQLFDYTDDEAAPPNAPPISLLDEIFFVAPLSVFLVIHLGGRELEEGIFPKKKGNAVWLDPETQMDWEHPEAKGARFLMIGYARNPSKFKDIEEDPHTPLLKRLDYQANSPLKSTTHPIF